MHNFRPSDRIQHITIIFPMQKLFRSLLLIIGTACFFLITQFSYADCGFFSFWGQCETQPPYCQGDSCTTERWVNDVRTLIPDLTNRPISVYIQDIVRYLLSFISIIAVIYIIYAGFQVMTGAGDEEKMKKARNIILYVIIGIIIMWLAYGIVWWALKLIKG